MPLKQTWAHCPSVMADPSRRTRIQAVEPAVGRQLLERTLLATFHFWHDCTMRIVRVSIAGLILAFSLTSCATVRPSVDKPISLYELNIDPLACTGISLRGDVQITKDVIHEPSIMPDRYLIVLRYREGGDEKQFTSDLGAGYNNVSLVSEVAAGSDNPLIIFRRYCVIEMWRFVPEKNEKYCYLWTIGDDSTNMKVMLEGLGGEFLDERIVSLNALDVAKLKAFSMQMTRIILDMLKEPVPDL
jgi:hypothetical protein